MEIGGTVSIPAWRFDGCVHKRDNSLRWSCQQFGPASWRSARCKGTLVSRIDNHKWEVEWHDWPGTVDTVFAAHLQLEDGGVMYEEEDDEDDYGEEEEDEGEGEAGDRRMSRRRVAKRDPYTPESCVRAEQPHAKRGKLQPVCAHLASYSTWPHA